MSCAVFSIPALKDLAHEHTTTTMQHATGYTVSVCTANSTDTFTSWGAQDDAGIVGTSLVRAGRSPHQHYVVQHTTLLISKHTKKEGDVDPAEASSQHSTLTVGQLQKKGSMAVQ